VSGSVAVQGSAADNGTVSRVELAVDGGAWQAADGTASWSWAWSTATVADGTHTVAARAIDAAGNVSTATRSITVANSVPSSAPSPTASPTPVSTAPAPSPTTSDAPATQGSWVSPEGLTINVDTAGSWTIAQVYSMVKANALDLNVVGPTLTVNVADTTSTQTQTSAVRYGGKYISVKSTIWFDAVNSNFTNGPDASVAHEYGHAWSNYWYYLGHQGDWSSYTTIRWTTADGSLTLATDSRTGTTHSWAVREIIADDYRILFGSSAAVAERAGHLNTQIPDPRNVPGLADYLATSWRMATG
jgi:hypothetical protein